MTSQDDLALLKQMHQRGEITDAQYDVLRRHVLWGTPLPPLTDDVPAPRPPAGYVPGAATVGPERYSGDAPPRRYASRRERREAEEAGQAPPAPTGYLPPAGAPPRRSRHRRDDPADDQPSPTPRARWTADPAAAPIDEPVAPGLRDAWTAAPAAAPPRRHGDDLDPPPVEDRPGTRRRPADTDPGAGRRPGADTGPRAVRRRTAAGADPGATRTADTEPRAVAGGSGRRPTVDTDAGREKGRRRPRRRSVLAVLTSVLLALALAAGGVYWFVLRAQGLPPPTYAREACGAVRDWHQAVDNSNATLIDQISRQENKTTVRAAVTAYYTSVAGRTDQLRTAILGLGAADTPGGREYADSLAAAVGDQATALRRLADRAGRLDPAGPQFATDLQTVLTGADDAVSAVTSALARPAAGITTELRTTLSNDPACAPYVG